MASPLSIEEIAQNAGVSLEYLENEISSENILEFAKYFTQYQEIGPYLGLSDGVLEGIDQNHKKLELKSRATLKKWKDEYAFKATYRKLIQALLDCRRADSATNICRKLHEEEGKAWNTPRELCNEALDTSITIIAAASSRTKLAAERKQVSKINLLDPTCFDSRFLHDGRLDLMKLLLLKLKTL